MPFAVKNIDKNIPNVLLIFGEEQFLVEELVSQITEQATLQGVVENSIEKIDGSKITEQEIVDSANNLSLISPQKLLIIENFDVLYKNKRKSFQGLVNYISNPNPNTIVIFTGEFSRISGISRELSNAKKSTAAQSKVEKLPEVLKSLIQNDLYVEFPRLYDNEMPEWLMHRVKKYNKEIDLETANLICLSCNSLREIDNEIQKLNVYIQNSNKISLDDVEQIVGINKENNVFELVKSVGNRDLNTSLKITNNLLEHSNQSVLIVITLSRYFITLFRLIDERKITSNKFQLAGKVGVNPYFIDDYLRSLNKFTAVEIENAIITLADIDEKLKSSSTDNKYLMFKILTDIIS
jgi:DNA polymerase-3 subunit delta